MDAGEHYGWYHPWTLQKEGNIHIANHTVAIFRDFFTSLVDEEVLLYLWSCLFFCSCTQVGIICTHRICVVKSMPKRRKSSKQLEKDRQENREWMSEFCKKKSEDSSARQQALKQLDITKEFNFSDHAEIYNYADCAHAAPIETVDATVHPPEITQYPDLSQCSSPCPVPRQSCGWGLEYPHHCPQFWSF